MLQSAENHKINSVVFIAIFNLKVKGNVIPLHAMEVRGVRGGIAPAHS
jgi:hypothetical protein